MQIRDRPTGSAVGAMADTPSVEGAAIQPQGPAASVGFSRREVQTSSPGMLSACDPPTARNNTNAGPPALPTGAPPMGELAAYQTTATRAAQELLPTGTVCIAGLDKHEVHRALCENLGLDASANLPMDLCGDVIETAAYNQDARIRRAGGLSWTAQEVVAGLRDAQRPGIASATDEVKRHAPVCEFVARQPLQGMAVEVKRLLDMRSGPEWHVSAEVRDNIKLAYAQSDELEDLNLDMAKGTPPHSQQHLCQLTSQEHSFAAMRAQDDVWQAVDSLTRDVRMAVMTATAALRSTVVQHRFTVSECEKLSAERDATLQQIQCLVEQRGTKQSPAIEKDIGEHGDTILYLEARMRFETERGQRLENEIPTLANALNEARRARDEVVDSILAGVEGLKNRIRNMVQQGACLDPPDPTSGPPVRKALDLAVWAGDHDVADFLLELGADPNGDVYGTPHLCAAILRGDVGMANILLARGASIDLHSHHLGDERGRLTPLQIAIKQGYVDLFDLLLAQGASLEAAAPGERTPLMYAIRRKRVAMADRLIEAGANVNASVSTHWDWDDISVKREAILMGSERLLRRLLRAGMRIEKREKQMPPLHDAVKLDSPDVLALLFEHGADNLLETEYLSTTALFEAVKYGYAKAAQFLEIKAPIYGLQTDVVETPCKRWMRESKSVILSRSCKG